MGWQRPADQPMCTSCAGPLWAPGNRRFNWERGRFLVEWTQKELRHWLESHGFQDHYRQTDASSRPLLPRADPSCSGVSLRISASTMSWNRGLGRALFAIRMIGRATPCKDPARPRQRQSSQLAAATACLGTLEGSAVGHV